MKMHITMNKHDVRLMRAAYNADRVKLFMQSHLGCTAKEVAYALNLSSNQAFRAVRKVRKEWLADPGDFNIGEPERRWEITPTHEPVERPDAPEPVKKPAREPEKVP